MVQFYLALTFWMMVALLEAYGIFKLFEGIVRPRWIHLVLLPGTVVAETGHFIAALLTGAPVQDAKLVSDESIADAGKAPPAKSGVPVLSPLLIALLPIVAAMTIIYLLYRGGVDDGVVSSFSSNVGFLRVLHGDSGLAQELGWRLGDWFGLAHGVLSGCQSLLGALPFEDLADHWMGWLFIYLTACLAIRMVPLRHKLRSGMAAILLVGAFCWLLGLIEKVNDGIHAAWPLVAYVIALLTVLLGIALLVRGAIALGFVLADKPVPRRSK
ncbi:MAG: hypothetical protein BIFFINMI_03755 [Phycisphaerae bacterium]|nr:hypothetical protein [Phycisphaerae bacterium]